MASGHCVVDEEEEEEEQTSRLGFVRPALLPCLEVELESFTELRAFDVDALIEQGEPGQFGVGDEQLVFAARRWRLILQERDERGCCRRKEHFNSPRFASDPWRKMDVHRIVVARHRRR